MAAPPAPPGPTPLMGMGEAGAEVATEAEKGAPAPPVAVRGHAAGAPPSLVARAGAGLCDLLVLAVIGLSFLIAAELVMQSRPGRLLPSLDTMVALAVLYFLVLFFLAFSYFTLFHFLAGQTPGKMLAGLQVEAVSGEPLSMAQAFLRSVGGLLQLLPLGLGYLAVCLDPDRRGWGDRLAGTRLVRSGDQVGVPDGSAA